MKTIDRYGTVLRIYDNGGKTIDRYTILPPRWAGELYKDGQHWQAIGCNEKPFHGVGMHVSAMAGSHLGKRIHWDDLPGDVKRWAGSEWPEFT